MTIEYFFKRADHFEYEMEHLFSEKRLEIGIKRMGDFDNVEDYNTYIISLI